MHGIEICTVAVREFASGERRRHVRRPAPATTRDLTRLAPVLCCRLSWSWLPQPLARPRARSRSPEARLHPVLWALDQVPALQQVVTAVTTGEKPKLLRGLRPLRLGLELSIGRRLRWIGYDRGGRPVGLMDGDGPVHRVVEGSY
jgi:hypothetical protein